jgi:hypothetical protein
MKQLTRVSTAIALALSLCLGAAGAFAQNDAGGVPIRVTNLVIIKIKADSPQEAVGYARQTKNFQLDEKYTPVDAGNGIYLVRGKLIGVFSDASAAGHIVDVLPDSLSAPN